MRPSRFQPPSGLLTLALVLAPFVAAIAGPSGLVSLAPNLTELVCALGGETQLVGRSSACDFPPSVTNLPVAGDFGRPQLETLARLQPRCVLVSDVEQGAVLVAIRRLGAECLVLPCESWTNLLQAATAIARALGTPAAGDTWCRQMETRRAALVERTRTWPHRPSVFVEIWGDPLTTAGRGSFVTELVGFAGGRNVAGTVDRAYTQISSEWVIRQDPDVLLLAYMGGTAPDPAARAGWSGLRAVRSGALCTNIPPSLLLRSGPRCLDGAGRLADWLEPFATGTR